MQDSAEKNENNLNINNTNIIILDLDYWKTLDGRKEMTQSIDIFRNRLNTVTSEKPNWVNDVKRPVIEAINSGSIGISVYGAGYRAEMGEVAHYGLVNAEYKNTTDSPTVKNHLLIVLPYTYRNQNHQISEEEFTLMFERLAELLKYPDSFSKFNIPPLFENFTFSDKQWFLHEIPQPAKTIRIKENGQTIWEAKPEIPPLNEWQVSNE